MTTKCYLLLLTTSLLISSTLIADNTYCCDKDYAYGKTTFSARPQGNYYFMTLMATADLTHRFENEDNYLNSTLSFGYRQNMDAYELGRYFFTQTGPVIVGPVNTNVDIQNLQLGLASNYKGTIVMQPFVNDVIIDLDFFAGFDNWAPGTWFRVRFPFVRNSWRPNMLSQTASVGQNTYPDGFADAAGITVPTVYQDISDAMCGNYEFGQIPALSAGKLCCTTKSHWGLSDVHLELGYDFIRKERGNMGIALIGAIATGFPDGKACNQCLLAPTIGTQNSSQFGCALRGQYELFNFTDKTITLYADARVSHVFPGCTKRLLSLNVGDSTAFNYWLLLNHYNHDSVFQGVERAANLLNKKVKVSAAALGELTLMVQTAKNDWQWALGYNLWFRSRENICVMNQILDNDYYAIKDTAHWATYIVNDDYANIAQQPTNAVMSASLENIKTAALYSGEIDVCAAQHPETYSNTLFASAGYHFKETRANPYLNIGGHIEWGRGNVALNTWGIYLQGGISI